MSASVSAFLNGEEVILPNTIILAMMQVKIWSPSQKVSYELKSDPKIHGIAPIGDFVLIEEKGEKF